MPAVAGAAIVAGASIYSANKSAKAQSSAAQSAADTSSEASRYAADIQKEMYDQTREDQAPWRGVGGNALDELAIMMGIAPYSGTTTTTTRTPTNSSGYQDGGPLFGGNVLNRGIVGQMDRFLANHQNRPTTTETTTTDRFGYQGDPTQDSDWGMLRKSFSGDEMYLDPGYAFRLKEGQQAIDRSAAARAGLQSGSALKAAARYGQEMGSQEYQNAYNRFTTNQTNQFNRMASLAGVGQTANNALANANANYANNASNIAMNNAATQGNALLAGGQANASAYNAYGNIAGNTFGNLANSGVNWGNAAANVGNYFGGNYGASGNWINPDTGKTFIYNTQN